MPPFLAIPGRVFIDPVRIHHTRVSCSVPGCSWPGVSLGDRGCAESVLALHLLNDHGELACQLLDKDVPFVLADTKRPPREVIHWS